MKGFPHDYYAFGLKISSPWRLPCRVEEAAHFASVRLVTGGSATFRHVPDAWRSPSPRVKLHALEDGTSYLRWADRFEFLITDNGTLITGHSLDGAPEAAFRTYMLGNVLAHALLIMKVETVHAANVVLDGRAIAIMGDSTYGKSTLTAAFLRAGAKLLSDDFMVMRRSHNAYHVYPGIPRIKLYQNVARRLAPIGKKGEPMTTDARTKLIFPVDDAWTRAAPLAAFYALDHPQEARRIKGVGIRPLTPREAYLELTKNSFNVSVTRADRLFSQFEWATQVVTRVPFKQLSYPRTLTMLPEVIAAVRADLHQTP